MEFLDGIINMRIKPSQKEILQEKASKEGLSISTYCHLSCEIFGSNIHKKRNWSFGTRNKRTNGK